MQGQECALCYNPDD